MYKVLFVNRACEDFDDWEGHCWAGCVGCAAGPASRAAGRTVRAKRTCYTKQTRGLTACSNQSVVCYSALKKERDDQGWAVTPQRGGRKGVLGTQTCMRVQAIVSIS